MTTQPEALLETELLQQKIAGFLGALDARACLPKAWCRRLASSWRARRTGKRTASATVRVDREHRPLRYSKGAVEEGVVATDVRVGCHSERRAIAGAYYSLIVSDPVQYSPRAGTFH